MKPVLLPGMDGTGLLFGPLLDALPDSIDTEVICYSTTEQQTYTELVEEIIEGCQPNLLFYWRNPLPKLGVFI